MVFGESCEGFVELNNDFFSGGNEVVKSGNLVLEGSSLFVEVSFKGVPISLGLIFSVKFSFLGSSEGVSDGFQEVEDSDDLFVVELGGDGSEGRDKGFEEGGVFSVGLKGFFNLGISSLTWAKETPWIKCLMSLEASSRAAIDSECSKSESVQAACSASLWAVPAARAALVSSKSVAAWLRLSLAWARISVLAVTAVPREAMEFST